MDLNTIKTKLSLLKEKLQHYKYFSTVLVGLLFLFCILLLCFNAFFAVPEVVYVDNVKLFDGFNMTKEMKKIGENQFNRQKKAIDSLYAVIQTSTPDKQTLLMKNYVQLKTELDTYNRNFAVTESEKIWKRLESYVNEFSNEHTYKLIIGADRKQNVLFAHPDYDITNDLIDYVNQKYEGVR